MKFHPSWKFWLSIICCLLNLGIFIFSANKPNFWVSVFCCACSVFIWRLEKFVFDLKQELLKKAFEKAKEEEGKEDADF